MIHTGRNYTREYGQNDDYCSKPDLEENWSKARHKIVAMILAKTLAKISVKTSAKTLAKISVKTTVKVEMIDMIELSITHEAES